MLAVSRVSPGCSSLSARVDSTTDETGVRQACRERAERNLAAAGKSDLVRIQRDALQRAMGSQLVAAVERLTDRTVRTFLSGIDEDGGCSIEAFLLEPELEATVPAGLE